MISVKEAVKHKIRDFNCKKLLFDLVPVLDWIRYYRWKTDFTADILTGLTVAIMNIPQVSRKIADIRKDEPITTRTLSFIL